MNKAIENFRANMLRVRSLGGIYMAVFSLTTRAIDASDLLRAQIVLGVSALDNYIHEITLLGMLEAFDGKRPPSQAFLRFRVSMGSVLSASGGSITRALFEAEICEQHGFLSFQKPERIADAVRLFSDIKLWQKVSKKLSMTEEEVKQQCGLIVDRRNKIAHEADMDPTYPGSRWPITVSDVESTMVFIDKVCEAIHMAVV